MVNLNIFPNYFFSGGGTKTAQSQHEPRQTREGRFKKRDSLADNEFPIC
jgi:hypothetical protein